VKTGATPSENSGNYRKVSTNKSPDTSGAFSFHHAGKKLDGTPSLTLGVKLFPCAAALAVFPQAEPEG